MQTGGKGESGTARSLRISLRAVVQIRLAKPAVNVDSNANKSISQLMG